ncbi:MAG: hypothetical protein QGG39_07245, partial [Candidatus Poribacteria bacterium]|nr:hypothetical protein [Candidatus Poribacteria bacterium]
MIPQEVLPVTTVRTTNQWRFMYKIHARPKFLPRFQVPDQVGYELEQLPLALMLQKNLCSSLSLTFF